MAEPLPTWAQYIDFGVDQFTDIYGVVHPSTRITPVSGGGVVVGDTYYPPIVSNSSSMLGVLLVGGAILWLVLRK